MILAVTTASPLKGHFVIPCLPLNGQVCYALRAVQVLLAEC